MRRLRPVVMSGSRPYNYPNTAISWHECSESYTNECRLQCCLRKRKSVCVASRCKQFACVHMLSVRTGAHVQTVASSKLTRLRLPFCKWHCCVRNGSALARIRAIGAGEWSTTQVDWRECRVERSTFPSEHLVDQLIPVNREVHRCTPDVAVRRLKTKEQHVQIRTAPDLAAHATFIRSREKEDVCSVLQNLGCRDYNCGQPTI